MYNSLFVTMHVSRKGKHFPTIHGYSNGAGVIQVPVKYMEALGLKEGKTQIALTLVNDDASLEAAKRKGVLGKPPFLLISIVGPEKSWWQSLWDSMTGRR